MRVVAEAPERSDVLRDEPVVHFAHPTEERATLCGAPVRGVTGKRVSCVVCLELRGKSA